MKLSLISWVLSVVLISSVCAPIVAHAQEKQLSKEDVEAIVKKVIQDNPDLIMKTLQEYQEKQQLDRVSKSAQNLVAMQDKINHDPSAPSVGNPAGDVTVTEFFDYHCGYCKRFYPEISQLLKEDKNVRVIFREFPILSEDSQTAAKGALAVYSIDKTKYFDYHVLLMQSSGQFTEDSLAETAKKVGIEPETFKKAFNNPEIEKDLQRNKMLAGNLGISGTPSIIIGTQLMPGAVPYSVLKAKVEEARSGKTSDKAPVKKE